MILDRVLLFCLGPCALSAVACSRSMLHAVPFHGPWIALHIHPPKINTRPNIQKSVLRNAICWNLHSPTKSPSFCFPAFAFYLPSSLMQRTGNQLCTYATMYILPAPLARPAKLPHFQAKSKIKYKMCLDATFTRMSRS